MTLKELYEKEALTDEELFEKYPDIELEDCCDGFSVLPAGIDDSDEYASYYCKYIDYETDNCIVIFLLQNCETDDDRYYVAMTGTSDDCDSYFNSLMKEGEEK